MAALERLVFLLSSSGAFLGVRVENSARLLRDYKFSERQFPELASGLPSGITVGRPASSFCTSNRMIMGLLRKEKQRNSSPDCAWIGKEGQDSGPMLLLGGADTQEAEEEVAQPPLAIMKSFAVM